MMTTTLSAQQVSFARDGNVILDNADLTLSQGELVGLIGPNGAGKSSLLRMMAGLQQPDSGQIYLSNEVHPQKLLNELSGRERAQLLAYLPQQETPAWPLQVEHLVGLGRAPWHKPMSGKSERDKRAIERALEITELQSLRQRIVTTLSGGELQRTLLARVFAGETQIILADEPIAALDPYHQLHMMELLAEHAQQGGAVLAALHDLSLAARFCSRLVLLHHGKIVADGQPIDVLTTENLEQVYGISAYVDCRDDGVVIIPRKRVL
ncbi:ABC transporter ATP-binding protein [Cellvibrio fibrivorans]|uniref:Iron complex transport system ATP-binding protein n=1 Tax=Cellvibrio fibrivorans TaxID=126350 RepID=A0ABU1UXA2_9GAMM|nr:ABC transporter ATP-binding protein [Cellvibrio fibrivorans]MDR7089831.1 iron complex transport system ATP-binding protein [Cellvibrio fibrivorans]